MRLVFYDVPLLLPKLRLLFPLVLFQNFFHSLHTKFIIIIVLNVFIILTEVLLENYNLPLTVSTYCDLCACFSSNKTQGTNRVSNSLLFHKFQEQREKDGMGKVWCQSQSIIKTLLDKFDYLNLVVKPISVYLATLN